MKKYEERSHKVVTETECVRVQCDLCKRDAERPDVEEAAFEFCNVGLSGGKIEATYTLDGEFDLERCDLCYECAMRIIEGIRKGAIK